MHTPEMSPEDVALTAERGDQLQVLDIRAPARLATGHIDVVPEDRFFNIAGSQLQLIDDPAAVGLDRSMPVAVVCARGVSSRGAANFLNALGFDARSVVGGMAAWMHALMARDVATPDGFDALIQFDRMGKGALAYLLVRQGQALVVDPPRRAQTILDRAAALGVEVIGVADTHVHADYISGAPRLAQELGIPYYLHPADNSYPYDGTAGRLNITPLDDGTTISLGDATITVHHTPGHTEGSVSYDLGSAILTGDFIFVNSIGRPDLGGKSEEWAQTLWNSLERARRDWPGDATIYPAHYASDDERRPDRSVGAPFGPLAGRNEPLAMTDRDEFLQWVASKAGSFPDAYRHIKAVNVRLLDVTADEADELEAGRNECALA